MKKMFASALAALAVAGIAHAQTAARLDANTASAVELGTVKELTAAQAQTITSKRPFAGTAAFDAAVGAAFRPSRRRRFMRKCSCRSTSTRRRARRSC